MSEVMKRILISKVARISIITFVSIGLGFILQMAAYKYNFPTVGMFIASKMGTIPSQPRDWGPNLNFFFVALFTDSICWFIAIWLVYGFVDKVRRKHSDIGDPGHVGTQSASKKEIR